MVVQSVCGVTWGQTVGLKVTVACVACLLYWNCGYSTAAHLHKTTPVSPILTF